MALNGRYSIIKMLYRCCEIKMAFLPNWRLLCCVTIGQVHTISRKCLEILKFKYFETFIKKLT